MLAESGVWILCIALLLALWPFVPMRQRVPLATLAGLQFASIAAAMAVLIALFIDSDFSVAIVASHSHTHKPLIYKIAAAWGQHEGSMLLWALVLSGAGALWCARHESHALTPMAMRVQSGLLAGTLAFILFTSNPFERLWIVPLEGQGLNPLLQDIGLAMHPPMLYLGYVGLSLVFSLAVAGMRSNTLNREWAVAVRPWVLWPWSVLTLGIGLGSWWAYRELGWGGWWFWDPVENASFIPWLIATALLHSVIVLEKRGQFARWVGLLATLGFACSLLGTFLVRSGVLTSVHTFASDPARGIYILIFLMLTVGYAFWTYAQFARSAIAEREPVPLTSRTHALLLNNLLLMVMAATVLTGTLYPVILQALNLPPISVGAPYYLATMLPLAILLILLGGVAPRLGWSGTPNRRLRDALMLFAVLAIGSFWLFQARWLELGAGVGLGLWMTIGGVMTLRKGFTRRHLGMALAHAGFGLFIISACVNHAGKEQHAAHLHEDEIRQLGSKNVRYLRTEQKTGSNYFTRVAIIKLADVDSSRPPLFLHIEQRDYPTEGQKTNEAAIAREHGGDWYAVAQFTDEHTIQLRLLYEPMMPFLWLSLALMALGGVCSAIPARLLPRQRHIQTLEG